MKNEKNSQSGFIAIVSVLIALALIGFLATTFFRSGLSEISSSSSLENFQEAEILSQACLAEGVFKLKEDINYQGEEKLNLNGKECLRIRVENISPSQKIVSSLVSLGHSPHFQKKEREIRFHLISKSGDWQNYQELKNLEIVGDNLKLAEGKIERITTSTPQWADYFSLNNLDTPADSLSLLNIDGKYASSGFRVSQPLSLDKIKKVKESKIFWSFNQPSGTEIQIKTATSSSSTTEPDLTAYLQATNGNQIPGINPEEDLTGKYLWVRQELATNNTSTTPILDDLTEIILGKTQGYWISLPIDLSGSQKKVFRSQIFWQADSFYDNFVNLEVRFSPDRNNWSAWQEVRNGGELPGLARREIVGPVFLQIKALFWGGPDIYPVLKAIKIFLELE